MEIIEVINGGLLADSSIRSDKEKYFTFQIVAKDRKFLEWFSILLKNSGIRYWISRNKSDLFLLGFYINSCPYPRLLSLREKWYKKLNGKTQKIVPKNLNLTPTALLFWYLGDGCLIRRKNDLNRVPFIVLATNCFSKGDIDFLIQKLKELNLTFYPVKYKSGFTGKECGYCLYSKTEDGTPLRFFQSIGLECPDEIVNCSTGSKGIYHEEKFIRNKWPTEEDWIKILSNVTGVNKIITSRRQEFNLSKRKFAKLIGFSRENIRDIELGKHKASVKNFRKILKALNLTVYDLLKNLNTTNS